LYNLLNLPETGGEATLNDAGHVPMLNRPHEVVRAIGNFFSTAPATNRAFLLWFANAFIDHTMGASLGRLKAGPSEDQSMYFH
jgi:hypothetical protein